MQLEQHFLAVFPHYYLDNTRRLFRIAWFAGRNCSPSCAAAADIVAAKPSATVTAVKFDFIIYETLSPQHKLQE